jgi:hypothetical protein
MPYKDPEHKRQWEREHREQRNAWRRTSAPGRTSVERPMPDWLADEMRKTTGNIVALLMGISFLLGCAHRRVAFPWYS